MVSHADGVEELTDPQGRKGVCLCPNQNGRYGKNLTNQGEGERKIALLQKEVRDREKGEQADRRDKEALEDSTEPSAAGHQAFCSGAGWTPH